MRSVIVFPLAAMAALTFVVLATMLLSRKKHIGAGALALDHFKLSLATAPLPDGVVKTQRHFANLFEMPVLFYAAGALAAALFPHDGRLVDLAWAYVVLRMAHALVHLTYNDVRHRFAAYAASNLALLGMWVRLVQLASRTL